MSVSSYREDGYPVVTQPESPKILARLRCLAEVSDLNLDRAERIKCAILHGPAPCNTREEKPHLGGLEDIADVLGVLINAVGATLADIECKLGE